MLRRPLLSLPRPAQVPALCRVILGEHEEPADPSDFADAAIEHRVVGSARAALDAGTLLLPEREAGLIHDAQTVAVLRSGLLRRELAGVCSVLRDALGTPPLVLKGPAIADRFYPDAGMRTFADLDVLVEPDDLEAGAGALAEIGYEEQVELQPGFGQTHGHDIHLQRPFGVRALDVELHWRIGDDDLGRALSLAVLSPGANPAPGAPDGLYAAPADQLLLCSIHMLSDRLKRLSWVDDIRRIVNALNDAQWRAAFARADDLGLLWVLHRALDYPSHHLGLDRERPLAAGEPPPFGPLRAVEGLDMQASLHVGRLAALPWRGRPGYIRDVLIPSRSGLEGTVGGDGAPGWRLALRHLGRAGRSLRGRR